MKTKLIALSLLAAFSFSGLAMAQDDSASQSSQQQVQQGPMHHFRGQHHGGFLEEALKNHPLTDEQKYEIRTLHQQQGQDFRAGMDKILTAAQKADLKAFRESHPRPQHDPQGGPPPQD